MIGVRVSAFNENGLGEPDQDANSALTELDKGLRSGKVGEQCEAIVRFPKLFEKYPFPILINASLLKLADVFRMGNNFLRLCVLRVCQQSEKHLDKISNVDEFVRRIYSVIHSNDPIARAVTLRIFGAVAAIIPERQQIHHCIRSSLDSHDSVEVEAAVYGAVQFAAQSKTFAISMCNKVSDMIQRQSTPANMKLQLIPILQYMHHDTNTAAMVRSLCIELLPGYPAQEFVLVTLNALTKLAAATLVDIPSQVNLLLNYLKNDPRWEIKLKALEHLYELAKPGAHLWPPGAVEEIINYALNSNKKKILSPSLRVLQVLVESPRMCHEHRSSGSKLRELCSNHCYSPEPAIAAQAIQILSQIFCYCYKENIETDGEQEVIAALETLILLLTFIKEQHSTQLKTVLKCAVRLCEAKHQYCEVFVELLGTRLDNIESDNTLTICEALGAIGSLKAETLLPLIDTILSLLNVLSTVKSPTAPQTQTKTMLCTLIFQSLSGYKWNDTTYNTIINVIDNNNLWANYCIARAAMRYGHHKVAHHIFLGLAEQVSSEHFHFWLICLKELSEAEAQLYSEDSNSLVNRLDTAVIHYNKAIAALKAASTPQHTLTFQAEYMKIRSEYLQCLLQLIYSCNILCIVPPPAIAATIVQSTRDEYQRHGYITNQLRKCVKDFKNCGDLHWKLYQTTFDADPATLENMQILQQMCVLLEKCVQSVCVNGSKIKDEYIEFGSKTTRLESQQLVKACESALKIAKSIGEDGINSTITHNQVEVLKKIIEILVNASLSIPRYFFQVLQSTSVKLAISPQPRVSGEFISVQAGSQLAVKVEGVIQHGMKPGLFRKIKEVVINVTSQLQSNSKNKDIVDPKLLEQVSLLTQTVTPHKDFFTAQFLLAFPRGGHYLLAVEASVIDEQTNTWKTGPKSSLTVKVPEETKLTPISVPGMASNANLILMAEDSLFVRPHQKKT
ncbi:integrator complex subunit 7 isoform X1 [Diabrotica virgifera virgifera]|uniref:Integrator complex subunit 7 n=2 Tax=Diabrotica virgifera virgifera TaxID=50390 RepID=A0ABM5KWI0_DIAVI|nr:integrator complex subunit 7 isoform X1 [Diabrotica virgifera virgifera]